MKVYESGPSRGVRVSWTLRELGVPFESIAVNFQTGGHRAPEFLALNPAGKIPVLDDDGFILTESAAIMLYLAEKYADKELFPSELQARAQAMKWMFFCATELEQPLWRVARHQFLYPEEKRLPADVALAREDFLPMAAVLEAHLKGRDYLVGQHLTVADIITAYTLDWATMYDWLADFPTLIHFTERMFARPAAPMRMAQAFAAMQR